jgi:hypothetical protein
MQLFFNGGAFSPRLNGGPNLAINCIHFKPESKDYGMNSFRPAPQKLAP